LTEFRAAFWHEAGPGSARKAIVAVATGEKSGSLAGITSQGPGQTLGQTLG